MAIAEKRFNAGAVCVTVWRNQRLDKNGNPVTYRTFSFQKRYKDKGGNWKTSSVLRLADLPKAVLIMQKAYEYALLKEVSEEAVGGQNG